MPTTEIIHMPNKWLGKDERTQLLRNVFSPLELRRLGEIGEFHKAALNKTEAILVPIPVLPGYLGDSIQSSRLASVLGDNYPDRVYVNTYLPQLFGKYPLVHLVKGVTNGKIEIPYIDSTKDPLLVRNIFMPFAEIRSLSPAGFWKANKDNRMKVTRDEVDLNKVEYIHQLHYLQALWELMYGIPLEKLPAPAIKIAPEAEEYGKLVFETLPVSTDLNIIIHPDSSNINYDILNEAKRWENNKWAQLLDELSIEYPNSRLFISTGTDHPGDTQRIINRTTVSQPKTTVLPSLRLPTYVALIDQFPKDKTIFIGLESMPASHLAPALGLRSIVLSDVQFYCRFYGPWGGIVVANNHPDQSIHTTGVEVSKVLETVKITADALKNSP